MHKEKQKRRRFSEQELEYICKFYEFDGVKAVAYAWERTEKVVSDKIVRLRKEGLLDYYKNLNKHW